MAFYTLRFNIQHVTYRRYMIYDILREHARIHPVDSESRLFSWPLFSNKPLNWSCWSTRLWVGFT